MSDPTPLMWFLLLLVLSAAFLYAYHPRWRRGPASADEDPVDSAELGERLQAMRSQMSRLMSAGAHPGQGNRPYESLEEALARGHQPQGQARPIVVTQSAQTQQGIDPKSGSYEPTGSWFWVCQGGSVWVILATT
jgi:hypothetical protein